MNRRGSDPGLNPSLNFESNSNPQNPNNQQLQTNYQQSNLSYQQSNVSSRQSAPTHEQSNPAYPVEESCSNPQQSYLSRQESNTNPQQSCSNPQQSCSNPQQSCSNPQQSCSNPQQSYLSRQQSAPLQTPVERPIQLSNGRRVESVHMDLQSVATQQSAITQQSLMTQSGMGPQSALGYAGDPSLRRSSSSRSETFKKNRKPMRSKSGNVAQFKQTFKPFAADPEGPGPCAFFLTGLSVLLILMTLPFSLCLCIKVVQEYERAVIFRLGRLRHGGSKGPGIFFVIPCIDIYRVVDLRTVSFDVPPQEILSRDSVTVSVDAVVYFNVIDAEQALCSVDDFSHSTRLLAATTLRNVLGTKNLAEILSEREIISHIMQTALDDATDPWGVKVERVEVKDVRLPVQLQRAMAAEAEAAREARAKVIAAEGEQKASKALKEAADVIQQSPSALQLRYLQTLNSIAAEHNSTIIFPMPISLMAASTAFGQ